MSPALSDDPHHALALMAPALVDAPREPALRTGTQQTARRAIEVLVSKGLGFHEPKKRERDALLIAFASCGKAIHGAAFDIVRLTTYIDLTDQRAICANMDKLELFEVKSTNRLGLEDDFRGYFFNLTTAANIASGVMGGLGRLGGFGGFGGMKFGNSKTFTFTVRPDYQAGATKAATLANARLLDQLAALC